MSTQTSSAGEAIGAMYSRWVLDSVIELAYSVSNDFVARPQFYQTVSKEMSDKLVKMRMSYGCAEGFPDIQQRQAMNSSIFGRSDAQRPDNTPLAGFSASRKKL